MSDMQVPTMYTINTTIAKLRESGTELSYSFLRTLCLENKVTHIRAKGSGSGSGKFLINFESLINYLNTGDYEGDPAEEGEQ